MDDVEIGGLRIAGVPGIRLRIAAPGRSARIGGERARGRRVRRGRHRRVGAGAHRRARTGRAADDRVVVARAAAAGRARPVAARRGRRRGALGAPRDPGHPRRAAGGPPVRRSRCRRGFDGGGRRHARHRRPAGAARAHVRPRRRRRRRGRRRLRPPVGGAPPARTGCARSAPTTTGWPAAGRSPPTRSRALAGGPALLLLHGANALTHTGFGAAPRRGRAPPPPSATRGGSSRFDHPTLSVDPAENCRRLLALLPADAGLVVDVLAHSRGGLVARMLDRAGRRRRRRHAPRLRVRQVRVRGDPERRHPARRPAITSARSSTRSTNLARRSCRTTRPVRCSTRSPASSASSSSWRSGPSGGSRRPDGDAPGRHGRRRLPRPAQPAPARHRPLPRHRRRLRTAASGAGLSRVALNALIDHRLRPEANDLIVPTRSTYRWNGASALPDRRAGRAAGRRGVDHSSFWTAGDVIRPSTRWLGADESALRAAPRPG